MPRLLALLLIATTASAPAAMTDKQRSTALDEAAQAMTSNPAMAMERAGAVVADFDAAEAGLDRDYVCARGQIDVLTKLVGVTAAKERGAAADKKVVVAAISQDICDALFIKGFALVELNRHAEAEPFLRRATEYAPDNAHYLNEYAEW